ncbi:MAG: alcohol dehydrogenase catalytic domain-containing protein [Alphaproteobacteria bacterium]|nr:alcohol dehydrogenase catalytic domain-containing protein [Alphaproteobacteria bacterium]
MKSYDVAECGAPLKMFERPTPKPVGSEVLLRVLAAGVCHSDIHIWEGHYDLGGGKRLKLTERGVKLPLTMGHETVGEVVALGPEAEGVRVGEKRLVFPWLGCGSCAVCRRGEEQLCLAPRFLGVFRAGGYADHIVVPHARYLLDIGALSPAQAAPYACSGLTAFGALKRIGPVIAEEPVVIIGAGGLGLMCLNLLKAMGGRGAIVVDTDAAKRAAAMKAGALAAIDGGAADAVKQVTAAAGGGIWAAIDFVGATSTAKLAVDALTKGGKVVVVGLFGGDLTLPLPFIPMRAMTIQGSYVGSLAEMKELLELVGRTRVPSIPITTRPLEAADATLQELRAGKLVGRAVLTP